MKKRRCISLILGLLLALSLGITASASTLKSFSDVPESFWAHDAIMDMVNKGMFVGTSTPVQGVGTFSPSNTMTRAQFVAVLTRYLYGEQLSSMQSSPGDAWYANNYRVALDNGLLFPEELDNGNLNLSCTRQEMAMMLIRTLKQDTGETAQKLVDKSRIADYTSVDEYYRDYVVQAYSLGLITGTDSKGTFNPLGALNRAQAATVIYRLVEPTTRNPVNFGEVISVTWPSGISYEGEIDNGEANGYGRMNFPGIGTYTGYFVDGKREGLGSFVWDIGDKYVGDWKKDAMHGEGTYTFSDGYVIQGLWENNYIRLQSLSMRISEITIEEGATTYIVAEMDPITSTETIMWESSNDSIVSVQGNDNLGIITAHAIGKVKITATSVNGLKSTCIIDVTEKNIPATRIKLNYGDYRLDVDERVRLSVDVTPSKANGTVVKWNSSNPSVATVDQNGYVRGCSAGTAIISVTTNNGLVATCYITVEDTLDLLWNGTWTMYSSDKYGNKNYGYNDGTCKIDIDSMTVYFGNYKFGYNEIKLTKKNSYTYQGTYTDAFGDIFEFTFTSITDEKIILEVNKIWTYTYFEDTVYTEYYVLYRNQ